MKSIRLLQNGVSVFNFLGVNRKSHRCSWLTNSRKNKNHLELFKDPISQPHSRSPDLKSVFLISSTGDSLMIRDLVKSQTFWKIWVQFLPLTNKGIGQVTELGTPVPTLQSGFGVFTGHLQHTRNRTRELYVSCNCSPVQHSSMWITGQGFTKEDLQENKVSLWTISHTESLQDYLLTVLRESQGWWIL